MTTMTTTVPATGSGPHAGAAVQVGALIDAGRWTGYQKWLVALVAMTIVFDGMDNQMLGITMPSLMREWNVPRQAFASVVSLGYIGMVLGGVIGGVLGDRFGRRTALLWSMAVFGAMTLAAAAAESPATLGLLRLLAGIGLGGAVPTAAALSAELVPTRVRPIAVTLTIVCVPVGGTLVGLLGLHVLPIFGWRMLFILGGLVPLVASVALRWVLPESPRFVARHRARWPELVGVMRRMGHNLAADTVFASGDPAPDATHAREGAPIAADTPLANGAATSGATRPRERTPIAAMFAPALRRDTIALWLAFFSCLLAVYLGFSWLPSLLTGAGFSSETASVAMTFFNLGGVGGALLGGSAIARFGSKRAILTMGTIAIAGAASLMVVHFTPASGEWWLLGLLALLGSAINGVQTMMYAVAAHVYPTAIRATGVGSTLAFGRIGAVLTGYVGSWAIDAGGATAFFGVVTVMLLINFAAIAIVTRHVPARGHA